MDEWMGIYPSFLNSKLPLKLACAIKNIYDIFTSSYLFKEFVESATWDVM